MSTTTIPIQAPFFAGQPFAALSAPWTGFFNGLQSSIAAVAAAPTPGTETYSLSALGTLAIASDVAPKVYVPEDFTPATLRVDLKQAPVGANLVIVLSYYTTPGTATAVCTFTVGPAELTNTQTTTVAVPKGAFWEVDITGVGTTFPGSDLTVTIQ